MSVIQITLLVAAVAVALIALYRLQAPRAGTERLVMAVWASFGPYSSAEDAENTLQRITRVVFGEQGIGAHEQWLKGHGANFRNWEAGGRFDGAQRIMCAGLRTNMYGKAYTEAHATVRQSFVEEAKKGAEWLNKDFLEQGGHRLEAVEQADGSLQFKYQKIWSDEQIKEKERETGEQLLDTIGNNISNDESPEAKGLLAFLANVYEANAGSPGEQ